MVTDDKEILELISNGELEIVGRLVDASNASLLCKIAESTQVIYKPIAGERPLWDFPVLFMTQSKSAIFRSPG